MFRARDTQRQRSPRQNERDQDAGDRFSTVHILLVVEPDVLSDVLPRLPARRLHERLLQLHSHHGLPQLLR